MTRNGAVIGAPMQTLQLDGKNVALTWPPVPEKMYGIPTGSQTFERGEQVEVVLNGVPADLHYYGRIKPDGNGFFGVPPYSAEKLRAALPVD